MKSKIKCIHMVGIGGSGMSGIAEILLSMGYRVTGSDLTESPTVEHLRKLGASVRIGHDRENVGDAQVLVRSTAVRDDNPEVREARGVPSRSSPGPRCWPS
jgi:UDP-N-acetylmuramate--alanine ligase